jgi:hypothetical protein
VLIAYWAAKGGSGATVLAAAHALVAAARRPTLAVDLDGDLARVLGVAEPATGVAQWLGAGAAVPADAVDRIAVPVTDNLHLLGRGPGPLPAGRADVLAGLLASTPRTVVVDCGTRPGAAARTIARAADRSILVTRSCYLAVRRQQALGLGPTEIALVREPARALDADDLSAAIGAPVRTTVPFDPAISRAVDAGLLRSRLPRALARSVRAEPRSAPPASLTRRRSA